MAEGGEELCGLLRGEGYALFEVGAAAEGGRGVGRGDDEAPGGGGVRGAEGTEVSVQVVE